LPISTFLGLQTSLRGLLAEQRSLDVTSHNIANANTEGYSRQEATLQTADALALPLAGQLGSGVDVAGYTRIRNSFLDLQYRTQAMQVGAGTTRADGLDQVELRLAEPGDNGIAARLNSFWGAWATWPTSPRAAPHGRRSWRTPARSPARSTRSTPGCRPSPASPPTSSPH
jgi:flagellar hook-associated protein 1